MRSRIFFALFILILFSTNVRAQGFEDEFYVTEIKIDKEKVMLNNVYAFKYAAEPDGYIISNKEGKVIIKAVTKTVDKIKTITTFTFIRLEKKKFTYSKVNTPEELFRLFADNNVIDEEFQIIYTQLKGILERYDGK